MVLALMCIFTFGVMVLHVGNVKNFFGSKNNNVNGPMSNLTRRNVLLPVLSLFAAFVLIQS